MLCPLLPFPFVFYFLHCTHILKLADKTRNNFLIIPLSTIASTLLTKNSSTGFTLSTVAPTRQPLLPTYLSVISKTVLALASAGYYYHVVNGGDHDWHQAASPCCPSPSCRHLGWVPSTTAPSWQCWCHKCGAQTPPTASRSHDSGGWRGGGACSACRPAPESCVGTSSSRRCKGWLSGLHLLHSAQGFCPASLPPGTRHRSNSFTSREECTGNENKQITHKSGPQNILHLGGRWEGRMARD